MHTTSPTPVPGRRPNSTIRDDLAELTAGRQLKTGAASNPDVIDLIQQDHDEVRASLTKLEGTPTGERRDLFEEIVQHLARHEAAEELIVHAALRDQSADGLSVAAQVDVQEAALERLITEMDEMDPKGNDSLPSFHQLRQRILDHMDTRRTRSTRGSKRAWTCSA